MKTKYSHIIFSIHLIVVVLFFASFNQQAKAEKALPSKSEIIDKMILVNDYWINENPDLGDNKWARSVYFIGNMAMYDSYPDSKYYNYAEAWAKKWDWKLNGYIWLPHADDQAAGQAYIALYKYDPQPYKIAHIQTSIKNMVRSSNVANWWWVDALFMAMPNFVELGNINFDTALYDKMWDLYAWTKYSEGGKGLYSDNDNNTENDFLWWRDKNQTPPNLTSTGKNIYWSRGNGWVIAAMVKVLKELPSSDSHYEEYKQTLISMAGSLKDRQRPDGFWNANLDDPNHYGGKETSGTAFFTYALAYGINTGILEAATYGPVVEKAWNGMVNDAVQANGLLGYVQGPGHRPESGQPVNASSTRDFGVGAFLLAGSEVVKMASGVISVPSSSHPEPIFPVVVSQSAEQVGNEADRVIDGNISNDFRWSAKGFPQWVIVDMGATPAPYSAINLWTYQNRAYQYIVWASDDLSSVQNEDNSALIIDRSGNTSTTQPISDATSGYPWRYVKLKVLGASGYGGNWVSINEIEMVPTPIDDQQPSVTLSIDTSLPLAEASGTVNLTATLSKVSEFPITVSLAYTGTATESIDYSTSDVITIPVGNISAQVALTAIDDALDETDETIIVTLNNPVNATLGAIITQTITITDNDSLGFIVSAISGNTAEEGTTATFSVALLSSPTADVTIGISSSDETEGTVDKASLTFATSNWNIAQTITVTGLDDGIVDGDQNYAIILAAATSSDSNYNGLKPDDVTLTNIDFGKNVPPSASNVSIIDENAGSVVVGDNLTGSYTFADVNGDAEGISIYRWLRNGAAIDGAQALTYTLIAADSGQIITFEVTPVAATGVSTGETVVSSDMVVNLNTAVLSLEFGIKQLQFSWPAVDNATHYQLMENFDGASGFAQRGADITTTSNTLDIAVHRQDWANARYLLQACNDNLCSNSNEVSTLGGVLSAIGYVKASNTMGNIEFFGGGAFGLSVALSRDGNTLAVGTTEEGSNATGIITDGTGEDDRSLSAAGAVYVFSRNGGSWVQQAYVKASNTGDLDFFGDSVALSSDGNTLAVGASQESSGATGISTDGTGEADNSASQAGAVYVFRRNGGSWSQQTYVKASNAETFDRFGVSVALSDDGNTLAVGAHQEASNATGISIDGTGEADNSVSEAGAVYVFGHSGGGWVQQAYVKASNAGFGDFFGTSVTLGGDGNTLAVGAWWESSGATGISTDGTGEADNSAERAGAVYVFGRNGNSWSQQAYIKASNAEANDFFGESMALSNDGNTLAVGARRESSGATGISTDGSGEANNSADQAGAVYVFGRNGDSWSQQAYVKASNAEAFDRFGISVALSDDGNTLAVGADQEASNATGISIDGTGEADNSAERTGAVYVFSRNGGSWFQQAYVKASNAGERDGFGISVSVNNDGNTLVVGASGEGSNATGVTHGADATGEDNSLLGAGAVYLY